jgi:predicted Zn-dependent protease
VTGFDARYSDGRTSASRDVRVSVDADGNVIIRGNGVELTVARSDLRIPARLGNSPRYLHLPDGARCETSDHEAVDAAFATRGGLVHALERNWALVAISVVITLGFLWAGFEYGLPTLARHTAQAIPPEMESRMGAESMAALDAHLLKHTRLMEVDRERVRAAYARVKKTLEVPMRSRLELRRSETLGANAFALPSGIVVMTDEMVELATSDEQLAAVLAHELGHVHHRHIMRSILQNSATALLVATLLGDVTSVTGLAASIPTFLVEQRYSREFEYEADDFALQWMRSQGVPDEEFAAILEALHREHGGGGDGDLSQYLSTHPSIVERIEAIRR